MLLLLIFGLFTLFFGNCGCWRWRDVRSGLGLGSGGILLLISCHLSLGRVFSERTSTCPISVTSQSVSRCDSGCSCELLLSSSVLLLLSNILDLLKRCLPEISSADCTILSLLISNWSLLSNDLSCLESWLSLVSSSIRVLPLLNYSLLLLWSVLECSTSLKTTYERWSLLVEIIGGSNICTTLGSSLGSSSSKSLCSLLLELLIVCGLSWCSCLLNHGVGLSESCIYIGSYLRDLFFSIEVSSHNIIGLNEGIQFLLQVLILLSQ